MKYPTWDLPVVQVYSGNTPRHDIKPGMTATMLHNGDEVKVLIQDILKKGRIYGAVGIIDKIYTDDLTSGDLIIGDEVSIPFTHFRNMNTDIKPT